jgi:transposase
LGLPLTASTIYDQCEHVANALFPVFRQLKALAADAVHLHLDDTTHRILDQRPIEKPERNGNKTRLRSGIYTSGVIAALSSGHAVVLFQTNIGHAGEWLDESLAPRSAQVAPPLLMSDALASDRPSVLRTAIHTLCNAHARRRFVEFMNHFSRQVAEFLQRYKAIWANDDLIEKEALSPPERLAYHREHSLPVMEAMRALGQQRLAEGDVEQDSGLGQAVAYFNRHYDGLSAFCHHEGAKIDNNAMEAQLKLVVRNRKNAYFYKTLAGAGVADVITSMIATGDLAGINVFDYFNAIQRNAAAVKAHPEYWRPWNYDE